MKCQVFKIAIRSFAIAFIFANSGFIFAQNKVPIPSFKVEGMDKLLLAPDAPHWDNGIDCNSCHVIHQSPGAQLTQLNGNANLCMSCHNPAGVASNKPFSNADRAIPGVSGTSHAWEVPAENPTHGAQPPADPEMALRIYGDNIVCSTCHNQHSQAFSPFLRASNFQNALCKDCHSVRDVGSYRDDPNNKGSHPVGKVYPTSDPRFFNPPQNPNIQLVDPDRVECTSCHSPHFADSGGANGGAGDGYILRDVNDDAFCKSCHTYQEHKGQSCRKCHQPHDPNRNNILLVKAAISTPNSGNRSVAFLNETGPNSFADGDTTYDGVCEVCHTSTNYHRNNSSGDHSHQVANNCTDCHTHDKAFIPPPCTDCHDSPQDDGNNAPPGGRRAMIQEFQQKSHHLQSATIDINDCRVCHEMAQHMDGGVRLLDRDDPQTVYALTNRPMDDPAEGAKIIPFCLNCHDGDSDTPFSDGQTPPAIDENLWNSASHKLSGSSQNPLSCIGDGESFGCHATGHGSDKRKLLAPEDASQPPVTGDPLREEEGMCYTCHDSNGPASIDIEAQFTSQYRHNISSIDQADGSKVECTNCHNPHIASSSNKLADPDSAASIPWAGDKLNFCLTCHDGGASPGVAFPPQSSGTGYDKSDYIGTIHADNLGGESCLHCHEQHGSSYVSLLKGNYVITDNNTYQTQDFDVCWKCHDENALLNQDNAFEKFHEEHVKENGFPCVACHDTHGPYDSGEPGLINFEFGIKNGFDIQFIDGRDASTAFWIDTARNEGNCYLKCHGKEHKPRDYDRIAATTTQCSPCH